MSSSDGPRTEIFNFPSVTCSPAAALPREVLQLLARRAREHGGHAFEHALNRRCNLVPHKMEQSVVPDLTYLWRASHRGSRFARVFHLLKLERPPIHFVLHELKDARDVVVIYVRDADDVDPLVRRAQSAQKGLRVLPVGRPAAAVDEYATRRAIAGRQEETVAVGGVEYSQLHGLLSRSTGKNGLWVSARHASGWINPKPAASCQR